MRFPALLSMASGLSLLVAAMPAQAAVFDFNYTLGGGDVVSGVMTGTLLVDGVTVVVSAVTASFLNGVPE